MAECSDDRRLGGGIFDAFFFPASLLHDALPWHRGDGGKKEKGEPGLSSVLCEKSPRWTFPAFQERDHRRKAGARLAWSPSLPFRQSPARPFRRRRELQLQRGRSFGSFGILGLSGARSPCTSRGPRSAHWLACKTQTEEASLSFECFGFGATDVAFASAACHSPC